MKVKVANRMYQMNRKEYKGLLKVAKEQVLFGIYALEKADYAELRCDKCCLLYTSALDIRLTI